MTGGPSRTSHRKLDAGIDRRLLFENIWNDSTVAAHNTLMSGEGAF